MRLEPRDASADFGICRLSRISTFCSSCFRHKRKTLRNNLAGLHGARCALARWSKAVFRAEQLGVAELAALYKKLE